MRVYDRDLIRGGHYGQRSCEPHLQAEHMAAPTNAAKREESSCQLGAVHTWHFSDVTARADDVSSLGESRHCGCEYLRSDFDPRVRPLQPGVGGGQISGAYRSGPVGLIRTQKFQVFSKQKTHFSGRKLQDGLSTQG